MGGGTSKVVAEQKRNDKDKNIDRRASNQDMARSYVSKVGAIRMILKNSQSKQAFIKFIAENEKHAASQEYLNYYFDTEEVLHTLPDLVVPHAIDLIERHKKNALSLGSETSRNILSSLGKLGKVDLKTLSVPEIMHYLSKSQGETFGLLTPAFEAFTMSDAYKAWRNSEEQHEKIALLNKRASSKIDIVRLPSCKDVYPYILIVDDSSITAKIASFSLQRDGHTVDVAKDGCSALELMKSKPYDLIIVELDVPKMNAFDLAKAYRKLEPTMMISPESMSKDGKTSPQAEKSPANHSGRSVSKQSSKRSSKSARLWRAISLQKSLVERTKPLVIIGMSVRDDADLNERVREAGMNGFMPKPFNINRFLEIATEINLAESGDAQATKPPSPNANASSETIAQLAADSILPHQLSIVTE
jgi:CheY-like chemotaxis protein